MPATLYEVSDREQLHAAVAMYFKGRPKGEQRTLIVPTSADVDSWRVFFSDSYPSLAFNMKVMTFGDYVDEKWGLFGNGTQVSRPTSSKMTMLKTLTSDEQLEGRDDLPSTPGTVDLLCRVAREGMGTDGFFVKLDAAQTDHSPTGKVWRTFCRYRSLLHSRGLMEQGEAQICLSACLPMYPVEVVAGFSDLTPAQVVFLESRGSVLFFERGGNDAAYEKVDHLMDRFEGEPASFSGVADGVGGSGSAVGAPAVHGDGVSGGCGLGGAADAGAVPDDAADIGEVHAGSNPSAPAGNGPETDSASAPRSPELEDVLEQIYSPQHAVEPTGSVRFAFSSGTNVEPQLVADLVAQLVEEGIAPERIYVVDDALPSGFECQRRLWELGISSCGMVTETLSQTPFGKAFAGLLGESVAGVSEFVLSPFSGISKRRAYRLITRWQSTKGIDRTSIYDDISKQGQMQSKIVEAAMRGSYEYVVNAMLAMLEKQAQGEYGGQAQDALFVSRSYTVAAKVIQVIKEARSLGIDLEPCLDMLSVEHAGSRYQIVAEGSKDVECVGFGSLAGASAEEHDAVVVPGLTAGNFGVSRDPDVGSAILEEAGIPQDDDYLAERRFDFHAALRSARKVVVVERPLAEVDGSPSRPSVLLEELVDCYREDLDDFDSLDRMTSLPVSVIGASSRIPRLVQVVDESDISRIAPIPAYASEALVEMGESGPEFPVGISAEYADDVSDDVRARIASLALGTESDPKAISPTAVERYMECPYKWFVERVLRPQPLSSGIDAIARGNFIHGVLSLAYRMISNDGLRLARVDGLSHGQIVSLVENCAEEFIEEEVRGDPKSPFRDLTELEKRDIDTWKRQAVQVLEDDRDFLHGYLPAMFECGFGDDGGFEYAGHRFRGIIDRVDVDEVGHAVVIDYKGSLDKAYRVPDADDPDAKGSRYPGVPAKIQTLVYATAAERTMGLDVVGTVYRSYSKRRLVSAVYDVGILGSGQLFGSSGGKLDCAMSGEGFDDLLARTEDAVADAVVGMRAGEIAPDPVDGSACRHCIAVGCKKRRG